MACVEVQAAYCSCKRNRVVILHILCSNLSSECRQAPQHMLYPLQLAPVESASVTDPSSHTILHGLVSMFGGKQPEYYQSAGLCA